MPAFANVSVFCMPETRANSTTSPATGCSTKLNVSETPQIVPAPLTVNVPFEYVALPAKPVAPTS